MLRMLTLGSMKAGRTRTFSSSGSAVPPSVVGGVVPVSVGVSAIEVGAAELEEDDEVPGGSIGGTGGGCVSAGPDTLPSSVPVVTGGPLVRDGARRQPC